MASVRSCWKLFPCLAEPAPAGSRMDLLEQFGESCLPWDGLGLEEILEKFLENCVPWEGPMGKEGSF